jgi:hypothetical protein
MKRSDPSAGRHLQDAPQLRSLGLTVDAARALMTDAKGFVSVDEKYGRLTGLTRQPPIAQTTSATATKRPSRSGVSDPR